MKIMKNLLLILCVFLFVGCATKRFVIEDVDVYYSEETEDINLLIEPYESLGIFETRAMRYGETTTLRGNFPEMLFGEFFPLRLRWNCWAVDKNNKEHFGQAIFSGIDFSGEFRFTIVIDGKSDNLIGGKVIYLSTDLNFAYDIKEKSEIALDYSFRKSSEYRKEIVQEKGTEIRKEDIVSDFVKEVAINWNEFKTDKGYILTPYDEVDLTGGIVMEFEFKTSVPEKEKLDEVLANLNLKSLSIGKISRNSIVIKFRDEDDGVSKKVLKRMQEKFPDVQPSKEENISGLAGINPQYSFSEKFIAKTKGSFSLNPFATGLGFLVELASAPSTPSNGWDFNSELPSRRNMGFLMQTPLKMKQEVIDKINQANMRLLAEKKLQERGEW